MGPGLERYEVLRPLGSGGMARVYLARHRELGTLHAVKVLKGGGPRLAARLRTEGTLQASLRHANVVGVTDVVESDGGPALVLELVEGPTLGELLAARVPLSAAEIDALGRGILAGVAAAHARGWVHRDLKPSNVLVACADAGLVPKVADFGLVKVLEDDGTAEAGSTTRQGLGTRRYMSLEQLTGAPADRRMDVFSLGALLFELAEGEPAFPTIAAWEDAIRSGRVPTLARPDLPPRVRRTVAAALAPRSERPEDASALLASWADGEADPPPIRAVTVQAARFLASHLPPDRLAAPARTAAEDEHLSRCTRCRVAVLQAQNDLPEAEAAPEQAEDEARAVLRVESEREGVSVGHRSVPEALAGLRRHQEALRSRGERPARAGLHVEPGDPSALATRLAALARPGQTLLSAAAARAAGPRAATVPHGHYCLPAVVAPIEVAEAAGEAEPLGAPPDGPAGWRVVLRAGAWVPAREIPHHLPAEHDRFVGRDADLETLAARVAAGAHLVTLHGPPGMGKTRLALRFARTWLGGWPGGAWFCDLSAVRTEDAVLAPIAAALDVPIGRADAGDRLGRALAARGRCLVVLDNAEQVAAAVRVQVEALTARAPSAVFLVTSRAVLGAADEVVVALDPLGEDEAVALFVDRATATRRDFDAEVEAGALRSLVRMLDGLPLAIELCAARVRTMSPARMLERIGERFRLLAGGEDRSGRHATLRAALDWSWELLRPWEQAALAQLSVFEGGFTLDAAEAVLDLGSFPDAPWPADVVQALAERAWIRPSGPERSGMLTSVQAYTRERLVDVAPAELRHGRFFARLGADEALRALDRHGGAAARRALALELANLLAAHARALARGDGEVASATALAAWEVLELRGPFAQGLALLEAALPLAGARRRAVLTTVGHARRTAADPATAESSYAEALELARAAGDRRGEGRILGNLAVLYEELGNNERTRELFEAALAAEPEQVDPLLVGNLANFYRRCGEPDRARPLYEQALAGHRASGNRRHEGVVLYNSATLAKSQGRMDEARAYYEQALAAHLDVGNRHLAATARSGLGVLHMEQGRLAEARLHYDAALATLREVGDARTEAVVLGNVGALELGEGRPDLAVERMEAALAIHRATRNRYFEGIILGQLGLVALDRDRTAEARGRLEAALAVHREVENRREAGVVLGYLGICDARDGDAEGARRHLEQSLDILREVGDRKFQGVFLGTLATLHLEHGRLDETMTCLDAGEALLRQVGDPVETGKILATRAAAEHRIGSTERALTALRQAEELLVESRSDPASDLGIAIGRARDLLAPRSVIR